MPTSNCHATQQEQRIPDSPTEIDRCMAVHVASLFTGTRNGTKLGIHHHQWQNGQWQCDMFRLETYLAVKESPLWSLQGTWMILSSITLSRVTQSPLSKNKHHMFFLISGSSLLVFVESWLFILFRFSNSRWSTFAISVFVLHMFILSIVFLYFFISILLFSTTTFNFIVSFIGYFFEKNMFLVVTINSSI